MKISPKTVNQIFTARAINKFTSVPAFKSQNTRNDIFVRTTQAPKQISEAQERKEALPKYLYHLTNSSSYEKIIQSGQIKLSKDIIDGVFMFDMKDFQTNWRNSKSVSGLGSLAQSLLEQALKIDKGLVLLKIPTESLDPMKIVIRPEDEVINFIKSDNFRNLSMVYAEKGGIFNNKWELPKNLTEGYSPTETKSYTDNGRAIEYIYQGNINLSDAAVEKVLELPQIEQRTLWGYGKKHFDDLFSTLEGKA